GVDIELPAVLSEVEAGEEDFFSEGRDHYPADGDPQLAERGHHQVVGDRALGRHPLDLHRDGVGLERTYPDREIAIGLLLLEDHDVLAGLQMHPNAVDIDFDQIFRFSWLLGPSLTAGGRPPPARDPGGGATAPPPTAKSRGGRATRAPP